MLGRSDSSRSRSGTAGRDGVTLIEVMVALSILSVVLVSLSGLMFQMGRQTRRSGGVAARTAAVQSALSAIQTVPWDSLPTFAGCAADTTGTLSYTRCVNISTASARLRTATIVIVPDDPLLRPDTVVVQRSKPRSISPLYAP